MNKYRQSVNIKYQIDHTCFLLQTSSLDKNITKGATGNSDLKIGYFADAFGNRIGSENMLLQHSG